MKYYILLFFCLNIVLLSSCEKDINLIYHQVDPIYVVEASVTNTKAEVRISQTNAMEDNSSKSDISQAKVTISSDAGETYTIPYSTNGYYRSSAVKGLAGREYKLDVEFDGHHFSSTSVMQRSPQMNSFRFVWMKAASERILFGDLRLKDIPNEDNWIYYYAERNGYRAPDYHRLDVSAVWAKKYKRSIHEWSISIYNLYNHYNPFLINFEDSENGNKTRAVQYSLFGIVPSVAFNIKF